MKSPDLFKRNNPRERGVAIIIVLSFVVLLTGLVVAFFSRALTEQQVSASSVNQVKADVFAGSAVDIIIGNLKQEIALSSSSQVPGQYYIPNSPEDAQPKKSGTNAAVLNLIRRSKYQDSLPVSDGASNLPIWYSATYAKRQISLERFNAHYLIPLLSANVTVSTPIAAASAAATSVVPQWILMRGDANGSIGPVVVNGTSDPAPSKVVGRYAYAIYDEGGLLDVNVAGFPSVAAAGSLPSGKQSLAYADLSLIPNSATVAGTTAVLTVDTAINDNLVSWRNKVSAAATGTSMDAVAYHAYVTSTNGQSGKVYHATNAAGDTDRRFTDRQQLIRQWNQSIYTTGSLVGQKNMALQYLGTFSRDLNQPSLSPNPKRPKTAAGNDDVINPSFLSIRVTSGTTRDGSALVPGDPLVKERFPLSKIGALMSSTNQKPYFGLSYNSAGQYWTYDNGAADKIYTLQEVVGQRREPDFFELLKASITVGSIGQTAFDAPVGATFEAEQTKKDRDIDAAIIQIGANIIDQYDADGYPTEIRFNGRNFYGIENLPYLYRLRNGVVKVEQPLVNGVAQAPAAASVLTGTNIYNMKTGAAVMFLQPEVWNPHQSAAFPAASPSKFRFVVDSLGGTVSLVAQTDGSVTPLAGPLLSSTAYQGAGAPSFGYAPTPISLTGSANTGIVFTGGATNFRDPFPLILNGGASIESSSDVLVTSLNTATGLSSLKGSAGAYFVSSYQSPLVTGSGTDYVGVYLGAAPLTWAVQSGGTNYAVGAKTILAQASPGPSGDYIVCQLQYEKGGQWYTYDEKLVPNSIFGSQAITVTTATNNGGVIGTDTFASAIDPRSGRFGMPAGTAVGILSGTFIKPRAADFTIATNRPVAAITLAGMTGAGYKGIPTGTNWKSVGTFYPGGFAQNLNGAATGYYTDPDGVVRRGMAAYAAAVLTALPESATGTASRPIILNRPFNNVGELGYVFSGIPWRNLDMSTPESGFAGLLDVFCINESGSSDAVIAGKVNINTQQSPVLRVAFKGGLQDEITNTQLPITTAVTLGNSLVARTANAANTVANIAGVVGEWQNGSTAGVIDGAVAYAGPSTTLGTTIGANAVERLREGPIRTLASVGNARVWNLMIDVFAQVGRYPPGALAEDFRVEGEQRYWVHIAIDRYTGEVIAKHIEAVQQ